MASIAEVQLPLRDLVWTLEGSLRAAKRLKEDESLSMESKQWLHEAHRLKAEVGDEHESLNLREWTKLVATCPHGDFPDPERLAGHSFAVALLRHKSRREYGVPAIHSTPVDAEILSSIWSSIYRALVGSAIGFSPLRSSQGFLSIPLCCHYTKVGGRRDIVELFRLHVWLPDGERGNQDFAVHSHQPWGQSWVLAGAGINHSYLMGAPDGKHRHATHDLYGIGWHDLEGNSEQAHPSYTLNRASSEIRNTGQKAWVEEVHREPNTRDTTYTIESAKPHRTEVELDAVHATLFFFDASRGFEVNAPVLGPIGGSINKQDSSPGHLTTKMLAHVADALRAHEAHMDAGRQAAAKGDVQRARREFNEALESAKRLGDVLIQCAPQTLRSTGASLPEAWTASPYERQASEALDRLK